MPQENYDVLADSQLMLTGINVSPQPFIMPFRTVLAKRPVPPFRQHPSHDDVLYEYEDHPAAAAAASLLHMLPLHPLGASETC